ncbi:hypothetical protein GPECTOR_95g682 [Gonium pectorale]|uniref:Protein kinase domain-containing protein n=1 Tax=Gonium pectorale TaxID=33097 RepID=A0A150G085_GONPE|nr:hypothetical protein GPECTOR_95g682 [Gonium pectorale]|eukprot:KXZ43293.1 hypothetical protein GPECTOR_95g682 [Gonium pectorale]
MGVLLQAWEAGRWGSEHSEPTGDEDVAAADRASRGHLQLNLRAVYSTLLEVALALRHMHALHMVHCDLKPQNVLLKSSPRDPRGFTAKLSDFGLAKMMAHDEEGQLVIDEAVGSGTLTHMAPESLAGQKQLTASIDLFAFGILMWQMVCGTRLYQGLTTKQIIRGVVRENLRPVFPAWVPAEYRCAAPGRGRAPGGALLARGPVGAPLANAVVAELESMVDATTRSGYRSWRAGGGGGGGGLDSPRVRPQAHAPAPAAPPPASQFAAHGGHGGLAQHHKQHHPAQHRGGGGGGGLGRPQAGNTGAGSGPSLLII